MTDLPHLERSAVRIGAEVRAPRSRTTTFLIGGAGAGADRHGGEVRCGKTCGHEFAPDVIPISITAMRLRSPDGPLVATFDLELSGLMRAVGCRLVVGSDGELRALAPYGGGTGRKVSFVPALRDRINVAAVGVYHAMRSR